MLLISRAVQILSFVVICAVCCMALDSVAHGQKVPPSTSEKNSVPSLMQQMVGTGLPPYYVPLVKLEVGLPPYYVPLVKLEV